MSGSGAPAVSGYRLTLPGGWARLTTGEGSQESIDRYLAAELRHLSGAERVLAEREFGARLRTAIARAEEAGAVDLYVSNLRVRDTVVSTRFSVAVAFFGASAGDLADAELAELAAIDPVEVGSVVLADARAVRTVERRSQLLSDYRAEIEREYDVVADPAALAAELPPDSDFGRKTAALAAAEAASTVVDLVRVSYLVEIPGSHGAYLVTVLDLAQTPLTAQQIELFDAIMSTLRWVS